MLVIGTYDENGAPDAVTAAWGGMVGGRYMEISISAGSHPMKA